MEFRLECGESPGQVLSIDESKISIEVTDSIDEKGDYDWSNTTTGGTEDSERRLSRERLSYLKLKLDNISRLLPENVGEKNPIVTEDYLLEILEICGVDTSFWDYYRRRS